MSDPRLHYVRNCHVAIAQLIETSRQLLSHDCELVAHLTPLARIGLLKSLLHRLLWVSDATLSSGFHLLSSDYPSRLSPSETHIFIRQSPLHGAGKAMATWLGEYPELARLWEIQTKCWYQQSRRLCRRAFVFAKTLEKQSRSNELIADIQPNQSAPHNGGSTVTRVEFLRIGTWFYKPRSGRRERLWFNLLGWLNQEGFPLPFRILKIKCLRGYCWMEAIRGAPCRRANELERFYYRAGALAFLIHLLRGVDFHAGNLVAAGEQPVFVDCESLLHPGSFLPSHARGEEGSILRTGLFPLKKDVPSFSAFGPGIPGRHCPRLRKHWINASEFIEQLVAGFRAMHQFVICRRARVRRLEHLVEKLQKIPGRTIYRPTLHYFSALQRSFAPSLLRSTSARKKFLQESCKPGAGNTILAQEIEALADTDIPLFENKNVKIALDFTDASLERSISIIRSMFD